MMCLGGGGLTPRPLSRATFFKPPTAPHSTLQLSFSDRHSLPTWGHFSTFRFCIQRLDASFYPQALLHFTASHCPPEPTTPQQEATPSSPSPVFLPSPKPSMKPHRLCKSQFLPSKELSEHVKARAQAATVTVLPPKEGRF